MADDTVTPSDLDVELPKDKLFIYNPNSEYVPLGAIPPEENIYFLANAPTEIHLTILDPT